MHKIYSRKRLIIPKIKKPMISLNAKEKHTKKAIWGSLIVIVALCVVVFLSKTISPIFELLCKDEAKGLATRITNQEATNVMREYSYQDLFTVEKDSNGDISMIKSNVFPINEIISDIALKIQKEIDNEGSENVNIPLGSFSGIRLLAGSGPNVNIKIATIGNVETDLKSEFIAQGINQTLHRVYLQVNCHIGIITPFSNIEENITNQVLIAENVIVGKIPSSYYNLEGMTNSNAADIIK